MRPGMRPPYRPPMQHPGHRPGSGYPAGPRGRLNEVLFPHGSVEATAPLMLKRRTLTKQDVQPVDGWRLVMALRSGLLMESTWALDVINILTYDDYAISYFGLGNMPGLLEALLEHFRATLIAMFGITEEMEASTEASHGRRTRKRARVMEAASKKKWFEPKKAIELHLEDSRVNEQADQDDEDIDIDVALGRVTEEDLNASRSVVLKCKANYTKRPRFSDEDVEIDDREGELFIKDTDKPWDDGELITKTSLHWEHGGGDATDHIVTHYSGDLALARFVRVLKEQGREKVKEEPKEPPSEQQKQNGIVDALPEEEENMEVDSIIKKEEDEDEEEKKEPEDIIERIQRLTGIVLRDPELARKRWQEEALEEENYVRDEPSLHLVSESNDSLGRRAVCISTILRNLSFVPGNDYDLGRNATFLAIVGQLLLLNHWYPKRNTSKQKNYDRGEDEENMESCTSLTGEDEWWWEYLHVIRENAMVSLANISGSLVLNRYEENIARPILNGLLEWSVSTSAYAQDPFPNVGPHSPISPQRLSIETLCKLCLHEGNVDLMLSTPPYRRIEKLILMLSKKLYKFEDQVLREFSINLLYYLSAADSGVARAIAMNDLTIGLLLFFIEQAEHNAMVIAQQRGVNALRDNPDSMGTSLDMLRRAASTLSNLSRHPDNIPLFVRQEQRLLALVMSQILDQGVASILSHVLFNIGSSTPVKPPAPSYSIKPLPPKKPTASKTSEEESSTAAKGDNKSASEDPAGENKKNSDKAESKCNSNEVSKTAEVTVNHKEEAEAVASSGKATTASTPAAAPVVEVATANGS